MLILVSFMEERLVDQMPGNYILFSFVGFLFATGIIITFRPMCVHKKCFIWKKQPETNIVVIFLEHQSKLYMHTMLLNT